MDWRWRPPAGLLALAQLQVLAQAQEFRHLIQALLTDQGRPDPGQIPLRQLAVGLEEELRRHKAQHAVSQELQPLVAADLGAPVLVGIGAVVKGLAEQRPVPEGVAQLLLQ